MLELLDEALDLVSGVVLDDVLVRLELLLRPMMNAIHVQQVCLMGKQARRKKESRLTAIVHLFVGATPVPS